jgi:glycerol-3-phosphate O-acyltransferase/dihydroxyacetone phosphate acyltransferase
VLPRINHGEAFGAVHDALASGAAVGIFPEGGSHDQPALLPLKAWHLPPPLSAHRVLVSARRTRQAGIAIMALGALAKHPRMPLKLVPPARLELAISRSRTRC